MKRVLAIGLLISGAALARAGTFTAATCNFADVNTIINGPTHVAVNGDIIVIPAGTCTWTSGIVASGIGITIIGSGTPNTGPSTTGAGTSTTNITQNTSAEVFAFSAVPFGQLMRYSLMNISPQSGLTSESVAIATSGICTGSGCPNIRMDNITFGSGYVNDQAQSYTISVNMFGVYDHNTFNGPGTGVGAATVQISFSSWLGIGDNGDESFFAPDSTGTAQALFEENNLGNGARFSENDVGFNGLGGDRYVLRYNTSNATPGTGFFSSHGTAWTGRDRGSRQKEVYRNAINCPAAVGSCGGGNFLSGTGYVFENAFAAVSTGFFNQMISLDNPRKWRFANPPWDSCSGAGQWDTNDGTVYDSGIITATNGTTTASDSTKAWGVNIWFVSGDPYSIYDTTQKTGFEIASNTSNTLTAKEAIGSGTLQVGDSYQILRASVCLDQPARSAGTLLANNPATPTGSNGQTLAPIYEWADTHSGNFGGPVSITTASLLQNRDIYSESSNQTAQTSSTSPFNGTSGNGHGTLANRPATCTTGVAYWATDQGSWNLAPGGEQGELFKCTATNTWTLSYTPYTYPHPLTSSTPQVATPTFSPPGGTYGSTQTVTVSTSTGGATLCFTVDGSTPTANGAGTCTHGTTYSSAITVSSSQTVKAVGSLSGDTDSSVGSATYSIGPAPPTGVAAQLLMTTL